MIYDTRWIGQMLVCCLFSAGFFLPAAVPSARADDPPARKDPGWMLPAKELDADPKIPTLAQVVGHGWGREISSHAEIEQYLHALAKAAPDRCILTPYGKTYQGKTLYADDRLAENLRTSTGSAGKTWPSLPVRPPRRPPRSPRERFGGRVAGVLRPGNRRRPPNAPSRVSPARRQESQGKVARQTNRHRSLQNPRPRPPSFHRELRGS